LEASRRAEEIIQERPALLAIEWSIGVYEGNADAQIVEIAGVGINGGWHAFLAFTPISTKITNMTKTALLTSILVALLASPAFSSITYEYQGNNFDSAVGEFTLLDSVSGFVTFASDPLPGQTGKSDVIAFSFSAGPVTITDTSPSLATSFSFDFSPTLSIVAWEFGVQAEVFSASGGPGFENIWSRSVTGRDFAVIGDVLDYVFGSLTSGLGSGGVGDSGGWTIQSTAAVPEVASAAVWALLSAAASLAMACRRHLRRDFTCFREWRSSHL
jgi:hypothetical protein